MYDYCATWMRGGPVSEVAAALSVCWFEVQPRSNSARKGAHLVGIAMLPVVVVVVGGVVCCGCGFCPTKVNVNIFKGVGVDFPCAVWGPLPTITSPRSFGTNECCSTLAGNVP